MNPEEITLYGLDTDEREPTDFTAEPRRSHRLDRERRLSMVL